MAPITEKLSKYTDYKELKKQYPSLEGILEKTKIKEISSDNLKSIFSCIDLTSLSTDDTEEKIARMVKKVNDFDKHFKGLPHVAAICVYPSMVETVSSHLHVKGIGIASVVGGFPSSQTFSEVKEMETEMAVLYGATECDVVQSVGKFISGKINGVAEEIRDLKQLLGKKHLKVILESGLLNEEQVYQASLLALEAGADFIKTSTGKLSPAATPEAVYAMCLALNEFYKKHGQQRGIKPAGGISRPEDAFVYLQIVRELLGEEWLNPHTFRIGASRLSNAVLEQLASEEEKKQLPWF